MLSGPSGHQCLSSPAARTIDPGEQRGAAEPGGGVGERTRHRPGLADLPMRFDDVDEPYANTLRSDRTGYRSGRRTGRGRDGRRWRAGVTVTDAAEVMRRLAAVGVDMRDGGLVLKEHGVSGLDESSAHMLRALYAKAYESTGR